VLCSCATEPRIQTLASQYITSETQGESFKKEFLITSANAASLNFDIDEDSSEANYSLSENNSQLSALFNIGLLEKLDFYTRVQIFSPIMYGLKIQLLGRAQTRAEYQGTSLSVFMSAGRNRYIDESENNLGQSNNGDYEFNRSHTITEYGLAYGYRLYSDILTYTRLSFQNESITGDINFEDNTTLDGERINVSGAHTHYVAGLTWYTEKLNIGSELGYSQYDTDGEKLDFMHFSFLIGKHF